MKTSPLFLLAPLVLAFTACSDDSDYDFEAEAPNRAAEFVASSAPVASFDPAMQIFPFPNNLFFAGSEDGTINIPIADGTPDAAAAPTVALNNMDGFSTTAPLTAPVTGTLDESTLVVGETIFVLELTTDEMGTPNGVAGSLGAAAFDVVQYNGNLELRPTTPLKEKTTYAIFVTDGVMNERGQSLESTVQYRLTRGNTILVNPPFNALEPLRQATRPFIDLFEAAAIPRGETTLTGINVAVSWTVTTQSIRDSLQAVSDTSGPTTLQVGPTGASTMAFNPASPGRADVYLGTLSVPYYQTPANTPAETLAALNSFWTAADGNVVTRFRPQPAIVSNETIPVIMTVPNATAAMGTEPAGGWPIAIFQHGITRSRTDILAIADSMADAGFAVIAIDMPMHGQTVSEGNPFHTDNTPSEDDRERTFDIDALTVNEEGNITAQAPDMSPDPSGQHFLNLANLTNSRDNLRQAAADLMVLSDSLDVISGISLDTSRKAFVGHSLGAMVGTVLLSYDTSFSSASLAMPGGGIARLLANSGSFSPQINGALMQSGIEVGTPAYEQFFTVAQTLTDSGDPINHAAIIAEANDRSIHLMEVIGDSTIPNIVGSAPLSGTEPLAAQLGLTAIDMSDDQGMGALVRFSVGGHGSILTPEPGMETFVEMQRQVATFAASGGQNIVITDASVIQPADMPPVPATETETETSE